MARLSTLRLAAHFCTRSLKGDARGYVMLDDSGDGGYFMAFLFYMMR